MEAGKPIRRFRGSGWLFKRPRTRFWWCGYYRNGKLYRESTHTAEERVARRFLQRKLGEVASDNFIAPQTARIKVEELAQGLFRDYQLSGRKSTQDAKARWELHLKPVFGHLRAISVTTDLIENYVINRQEKGAANATINREMAFLKRSYNLGRCTTPPKVFRMPAFRKLSERNVRKGFIEDHEYQKLATAAASQGLWLRAMLETGYAFGWRVSELLNLRVSQLDLLNRTIRLNPGETKNDDGRVVIMTNSVHQLLTQCVAGKKPEDSVFTRENGKPVQDFRGTWANICCSGGLGKLVCSNCDQEVDAEKHCATCGHDWTRNELKYRGLIFHDLRRTAVRNMVRAGVPERVAMQISGHRTRAIFDRYHIVSENDLREAAMKMERRHQTAAGVVPHFAVQTAPPTQGEPARPDSVH
jgi:integrase